MPEVPLLRRHKFRYQVRAKGEAVPDTYDIDLLLDPDIRFRNARGRAAIHGYIWTGLVVPLEQHVVHYYHYDYSRIWRFLPNNALRAIFWRARMFVGHFSGIIDDYCSYKLGRLLERTGTSIRDNQVKASTTRALQTQRCCDTIVPAVSRVYEKEQEP